MAKFYAVRGEENKIFDSWDKCKAFLEGKKGYKYKSFSSRAEAEAYLSGEDFYEESIKKDLAYGYAAAVTKTGRTRILTVLSFSAETAYARVSAAKATERSFCLPETWRAKSKAFCAR